MVHQSNDRNEPASVNQVVWEPTCHHVLSGTEMGKCLMWHGSTFHYFDKRPVSDYAIRTMLWSPGDEWLVFGDEKGYVRLLTPHFATSHTFRAHHGNIYGLAFAPTGMRLATGSDDGVVKLWDASGRGGGGGGGGAGGGASGDDTASTDQIAELRGHGYEVRSLAWHPTLSLLASASRDSTIRLWDASSGKNIDVLCVLRALPPGRTGAITRSLPFLTFSGFVSFLPLPSPSLLFSSFPSLLLPFSHISR